MFAPLLLAIVSQVTTPAPSASPSATPSPAPSPPVSVTADFSVYVFHTDNGVSLGDLSNGLVTLNATSGNWKLNATAGDYGFPTVGFPLTPDTQAGTNEQLYTALPVAALTYNFNSHFNFAVGKFAALLGQESPFTFQNPTIERGIAWSMEPTISRGVQAAYTNGPWSVTLQENDAYYSGHNRAVEWLIGWQPTAQSNWQFAGIVPPANTPPNPTASIGNKAEYDFMYTYKQGKLALFPYLLYVYSPASAALGYTANEHAIAAVLTGTWTWSPQWSIAVRYENARNGSPAGDTSPNADLIGFGAGSGAQSFTITPAFRFGNSGSLRLEYSRVMLAPYAFGFGTGGNAAVQNRIGFEFGVLQ